MSAPYTQRDPQVTSSLTLFLLAGSSGIQQPLHSAAGKKKKKGSKKEQMSTAATQLTRALKDTGDDL